MEARKGKTLEGLEYSYYHCSKCKEEILTMKQLEELAKKYTAKFGKKDFE